MAKSRSRKSMFSFLNIFGKTKKRGMRRSRRSRRHRKSRKHMRGG